MIFLLSNIQYFPIIYHGKPSLLQFYWESCFLIWIWVFWKSDILSNYCYFEIKDVKIVAAEVSKNLYFVFTRLNIKMMLMYAKFVEKNIYYLTGLIPKFECERYTIVKISFAILLIFYNFVTFCFYIFWFLLACKTAWTLLHCITFTRSWWKNIWCFKKCCKRIFWVSLVFFFFLLISLMMLHKKYVSML